MIRTNSRICAAVTLLLLTASTAGRTASAQSAASQATAAQSPTEHWTASDFLTQETAGSFAISPDNKLVVWTKSEMDEKKGGRYANLWITRVADGESWPLTQGKDSFGQPKWSPDGKLIAFTSSRDVPDKPEDASGSQLWLMRLEGGEPWPVTSSVRGLDFFDWKGASNDTIIFSAEEAITQYERAKKKNDDTAEVVEDTLDASPVRIWQLAVESKDIKRLTDNDDPIETMALSPDGKRAVTVNTVSLSFDYDAKTPPNTYLVDLATGKRKEILRDPIDHEGNPFRVVPGSIEWARDGSGVYIGYEYSTHPIYRNATITLIGFYDPSADTFARVDLEWPQAIDAFDVVPGGFLATMEDGVRVKFARYTKSKGGWKREWIEGEDVGKFFRPSVSRDGKAIAYSRSTAMDPTQPYFAMLDGKKLGKGKQLAKLNASFAKKPPVRADVIRWKGALGETVEGILYYPIGYKKDRKYPLILSIHGGPAGADRDAWDSRWSAPVLLYLERGAFALKVNYHGSCCYGLEWVESIADGKYYSLEIPDIEAGVDTLIAQGLVAPDSIATAGWSNGAILSTALTVANPDRYKAAIIGAGDVEWISDWGNVDFGASFDNYYFGASPIEDPQRYIELSPYFKLPAVKTPTLLFTGTADRNVPPSQSWSHFRALQQLGNTETRLVLFPDEPHGLRKLAHQKRKIEEEMRWLDTYLWGKPDTTNVALADDSPLAAALKLGGVKRDGGLFGQRVNGVLVPELVRRDSLDVGRFEVTRAQWKVFDPEFVIETGTENYPVTGITFDRAKAYAAWLVEKTGRKYRLPTKAEREKLDGSGGNTLDYWAGYSVNPDDAALLASLIDELPGAAPLLREVGSSSDAAGKPAVYDLGGNAAEWAVKKDGTGVAVGGSADRPADKSADEDVMASAAYRGLRVVADR